jgi:hypothetical protein
MKTGPKLLLAGAAGVAIAILAVAWNSAFAADTCADDMKPAAIEETWSLVAAKNNVTLSLRQGAFR